MQSDVARDLGWQRPLIPRVKQIIANYLIVEAPFEEDARHNTDLIVLEARTIRVACRVRRSEYLTRRDSTGWWRDQFTIRAVRPSGAETELTKMLAGWGDYIFYGIVDPSGLDLAVWTLGRLDVFRVWHHRELWSGRRPGIPCKNGDKSSDFYAYRIEDLPAEFVVARKSYRETI